MGSFLRQLSRDQPAEVVLCCLSTCQGPSCAEGHGRADSPYIHETWDWCDVTEYGWIRFFLFFCKPVKFAEACCLSYKTRDNRRYKWQPSSTKRAFEQTNRYDSARQNPLESVSCLDLSSARLIRRVEDRHTLLCKHVCTTCRHRLTHEEQGDPVLVLQTQAEWQEVSAETKVSWPTSTILPCIHPHHCFSCIEVTHKTVLRGLCIYSHNTPENVDSMDFKTVVVGGQSCDELIHPKDSEWRVFGFWCIWLDKMKKT